MYTCASSHSSVGVILFVCFPILKRLIDIYDLLNAGRRPRASGDVYMWRDVYLLIYIYIYMYTCVYIELGLDLCSIVEVSTASRCRSEAKGIPN